MRIFTEKGLQKELIRRQEEQEEAKYKRTQWYELRDDVINALDKLDLLIEYMEQKQTPKHDGCEGCKYINNTEDEYPCSSCKQNYVDRWEKAE